MRRPVASDEQRRGYAEGLPTGLAANSQPGTSYGRNAALSAQLGFAEVGENSYALALGVAVLVACPPNPPPNPPLHPSTPRRVP
jgi:hypothetical protein